MAIISSFYRPTWADYDKDKLNTRHEVLAYSSLSTPQLDCNENRCNVVYGFWECPYSGILTNDPNHLNVDHVVTLKNAYESGGKSWTRSRWRAFANDEANLLAVEASHNRSKGARGPDKWPSESKWREDRYWCDVYLPLYLSIKKKWGLELINNEAKVSQMYCEESFPSEQ